MDIKNIDKEKMSNIILESKDEVFDYLSSKLSNYGNTEIIMIYDMLFQIYGYMILSEKFKNTSLYKLSDSITKLANIKKFEPKLWEKLDYCFHDMHINYYNAIWKRSCSMLSISLDNLINRSYIYKIINGMEEL